MKDINNLNNIIKDALKNKNTLKDILKLYNVIAKLNIKKDTNGIVKSNMEIIDDFCNNSMPALFNSLNKFSKSNAIKPVDTTILKNMFNVVNELVVDINMYMGKNLDSINSLNSLSDKLIDILNNINKISSIYIMDPSTFIKSYNQHVIPLIDTLFSFSEKISYSFKNHPNIIDSDDIDKFNNMTNELTKLINDVNNTSIKITSININIEKISTQYNILVDSIHKIYNIYDGINNELKKITESENTLSNNKKYLNSFSNITNTIIEVSTIIDNISKMNFNIKNIWRILFFYNYVTLMLGITSFMIKEIFKFTNDIGKEINDNKKIIKSIDDSLKGLISILNNVKLIISHINDLIDSKKNPLMRNILVISIIKKKINKIFNDLLDIISNIKERIIQLINHIQNITQNINDDNINETINNFTSLINNLFNCINDILNPKKNPLMRNALIISIIKKKINKIFNDLLDIISNIKEKIIQLFINIQNIDATKIEKSITSINDIFKNLCIIIDNIIKLSYKSALLILLYPIVSICIGICSLMILSIVFMISALNLMNYQKLQLTISNVKILFDEFSSLLTKLKLIAISIILLAPLMALAILLSPLVLIELYIFTFIIKALVYIINLIKVGEINNIQFMLLKIGIILIAFISLSLLLILLQEIAIHIKVGVVIAALLGIIALVVALMLVGFVCSKFIMFLTPVITAISLTVLAIVIIVGSLLILAVLLNKLNEIDINVENIRNNVREIMSVVTEIISAIFDPTDDKNTEPSKKGFFGTLFTNLFMGSAQMIGAIMAMGYLALMTVSVLLVLFIATTLRVLQVINLDSKTIKDNVKKVTDTARDVINSIFDPTDDKNTEPTKKGFFETLFNNLFMGSAQMIGAIMAMGYLALMTVSVLLVLFIATTLRVLQVINLDSKTIKDNVKTVIDTTQYVINAIFDPTDDKNAEPSKKGFFETILTNLFMGSAQMIGAIMAVGYLALMTVSVLLVLFIATTLRVLQTIELNPDAIKKNVSAVMSTANSIIETIFKPDTTETKPAKPSLRGLLKWAFPGTAALIESMMTLGYLATMMTAIGTITIIAKNLAYISKLPSMAGIDKKTKDIVKAAKCVVTAIFDPKTGDIGKISDSAEKSINYLKKISSVTSQLEGISKNFNKLALMDKAQIDKSNTSIKAMLSCLTTPFENQKEFSVTKVNAVLKVIQHMNKMLSMSSKGFDNSNELLKNYTEFVTKVDNADLAKLQTTVKMFEQMAKFSESINGNFDKLAESLNEKIAPLLEELKESMGRVANNSDKPTDMQAEKDSIKTQMQANGQTKNMTDKEIDTKVNNRYNEQQQQKLGIDEITSKLTALINLFQSGEAIVRTS